MLSVHSREYNREFGSQVVIIATVARTGVYNKLGLGRSRLSNMWLVARPGMGL